MTDEPLPFYVAGVRIGLVQNVTSVSGFTRGKLLLDENASGDVSAIQSAVSLARQVGEAAPAQYSAAWQAWRSECARSIKLASLLGIRTSQLKDSQLNRIGQLSGKTDCPTTFCESIEPV